MASQRRMMPMRVREAAVYSLGAALAFLTDVCLLWLLVEYIGIHYLAAATLSFLAGTAVVYWVSIHHAFRFRRVGDARAEFGIFATIGGIGVLLNLALMFVFVERTGIHYLLAKAASASITFCTNFVLRRWLLFSRLHQSDRAAAIEVDSP